MKCNDCGFEQAEGFSYCPKCGAGPQPVAVSQNPAAVAILAALKDKLFLVVCILMSASCILSLAADGLPLIAILSTVFLWLAYAQSRKDIADPKHLRCVSGTVYAEYVILNVVAVLVLVMGMIFAVAFGSLAGNLAFVDTLLEGFIEMDDSIAELAGIFSLVSGGVLMVIFTLAAVMIAVLNIFSLRYIHRFAKSVYQSIENGVLELKHVGAAQTWLFIFGGFSALSALGTLGEDPVTSLGNSVHAAIFIISGLLIRKYLNPKQ